MSQRRIKARLNLEFLVSDDEKKTYQKEYFSPRIFSFCLKILKVKEIVFKLRFLTDNLTTLGERYNFPCLEEYNLIPDDL